MIQTTGVRFSAEAGTFFSSPPRPDRLWAPPSLLPNWYRGLFPRGWRRLGMKLYLHPPIRLHGVGL